MTKLLDRIARLIITIGWVFNHSLTIFAFAVLSPILFPLVIFKWAEKRLESKKL